MKDSRILLAVLVLVAIVTVVGLGTYLDSGSKSVYIVRAQDICFTPFPDDVSSASLDPSSGAANSLFTVHLVDVPVDEVEDQPVEVFWNWDFFSEPEVIGVGSVPAGTTAVSVDAFVPEDADPGTHTVVLCRFSNQDGYTYLQRDFTVEEQTSRR